MKSKTIAFAAAALAAFGAFSSVAQAEVLVTDEDRYRHQADRLGYSGGVPAVPQPDYRNFGRDGLPYILGGVAPGLQNRVYINNWRDYGLQRPPRDHRWVRIGDQFVLQRR
ncbi:RcnB family protein [Ramlibacter pallidus]|uniref:RcnB family protein n=1 Tax=Ramlibacter pallidus TaxID=2780087 RepID=A0ABR9S4V7_9BURK|nr:RcnB family protein [Ramlibacter pallidus]MBE7368547.1 RcnB family protein [Ramlibacter pallidus]